MLPDVLDPAVVHHAVSVPLVRHDRQRHGMQPYAWRAYQHALGRVFPWLAEYISISLDDAIWRLAGITPVVVQDILDISLFQDVSDISLFKDVSDISLFKDVSDISLIQKKKLTCRKTFFGLFSLSIARTSGA